MANFTRLTGAALTLSLATLSVAQGSFRVLTPQEGLPVKLSGDGSTILSRAGSQWNVIRGSTATPIAFDSSTWSVQSQSISDDGNVVALSLQSSSSTPSTVLARWTNTTGLVSTSATYSSCSISGDGLVIGGSAGGQNQVLSPSGATTNIPGIASYGYYSSGLNISATLLSGSGVGQLSRDGSRGLAWGYYSLVAGANGHGVPQGYALRSYYFDVASSVVSFSIGNLSSISAMDDSGTVFLGNTVFPATSTAGTVVRNTATGVTTPVNLPPNRGVVAMSGDGSSLLTDGFGSGAGLLTNLAVYNIATGQSTLLASYMQGLPAGTYWRSLDISDDGRRVIGIAFVPASATEPAYTAGWVVTIPSPSSVILLIGATLLATRHRMRSTVGRSPTRAS